MFDYISDFFSITVFAASFIPILILVAFCIWLPWVLGKEFINSLPSQRRKRRSWYCQVCGYNLKANTTGICPECGTAFLRNPPA